MVIILESPFNTLYRKAYLRQDSKGRRRVDLIISRNDRTTISYARYLMCVKIGYVLSNDYEVDHIDGNCNNDEILNLQILTKEEHLLKTVREATTGRNMKTLLCVCCGCEFEREVRNIKSDRSICSRSCNGRLSTNVPKKALELQDVVEIRNVFVKNDRNFGIAALARIYQVSKNTISRALYDHNYI